MIKGKHGFNKYCPKCGIENRRTAMWYSETDKLQYCCGSHLPHHINHWLRYTMGVSLYDLVGVLTISYKIGITK